MNRNQMLQRLESQPQPWDIIVIGGGATGMGIAVDAASRGFEVLLLEREDFGSATSSRSTKLVHGGVRYLEQGNISLVMEALKERGIMRRNAPHLVHDLGFVVPNYSWWEAPFYGIGMKVYDLLAGRYGFGKSRLLSREETLERLPTIKTDGLKGGVVYYDGQFDDTRLLIHLAMTAAEQGAVVLNYSPVVEMTSDGDGFVNGIIAVDRESGQRIEAQAKVVINAAGIFADEVRQMIEPEASRLLDPSQGIHLVFDGSFLPRDTAIMVPHTDDGRVLFAIPWHGHTIVGTTDTPIEQPTYNPLPQEEEIRFILDTAARYLSHPPQRSDILSVYTGIRPLVRPEGFSGKTSSLSRDHTIHVDKSGLLTIVGGKWTTYRHMAEDCVDHAILLGKLDDRPSLTRELKIHGSTESIENDGSSEPFGVYGSDADAIRGLAAENPEWDRQLHPELPYIASQVIWAVREEMARTVDDVLSRRTRALFLNARAAIAMAPEVARLMAGELREDKEWMESQVKEFRELAQGYLPPAAASVMTSGENDL